MIDRIVSQDAPPVFFTVKNCLDRLADPRERRSLLVQPARWCAAPESLVEEEAIRAVDRARAAGVAPADFWDQLGLAALARETLCEATWRGLGLWRDEVTPHVLEAAANFFRPRPDVLDPTTPIEFDHPGYVREVRRHLAGREAELHGRLADACLRWQQLSPPARDYALRHAAEHLQAAGRQTQLRDLLLCYDWLDARLEQDGIWPVLADYALSAPDDAIRRVTEALRRSVQTLTADPEQLPAQLFGRLGDDPQLAVLLDAAARRTRDASGFGR